MKIVVQEVKFAGKRNIIIFSTDYGSAQAVWKGEMPEIGKEYVVELEINEPVIWGENLTRSESNKFTIGMESSSLMVEGYLESVEEDGYSVLRLAGDMIVLEIIGMLPSEGIFVRLQTIGAELYDMNY